MPDPSSADRRSHTSTLEDLAREGVVRLPTKTVDDFLRERGPLTGPVTDVGTRAVEEQRGERV